MTAKKTFREVLAERRSYESNSGERLTDVGGNKPRPMDTKTLVKHLVSTELSNLGQEAGYETFEEADDFEDEDPEPPWSSQYEIQDLEPEDEPFHVPPPGELPQDDLEGRAGKSEDNDESKSDDTGAPDDGVRE